MCFQSNSNLFDIKMLLLLLFLSRLSPSRAHTRALTGGSEARAICCTNALLNKINNENSESIRHSNGGKTNRKLKAITLAQRTQTHTRTQIGIRTETNISLLILCAMQCRLGNDQSRKLVLRNRIGGIHISISKRRKRERRLRSFSGV